MSAAEHLQQRPVNVDAERQILGTLLAFPEALTDVERIGVGDFSLPRHARIFGAILACHADRGITDPTVVADELQRRGVLEECGGTGLLVELVSEAYSGNILQHVAIVREWAQRSRIVDTFRGIAQRAIDGESVDELLAVARQVVDERTSDRDQTYSVRSWTDVAVDPPVMWVVDGMVPIGGLVVVGGDPGAGKTLLVLDLALRAVHGMPWFGRGVRPASTLYLAGEGARGLGARLRAWRAAHRNEVAVDGHYCAIADSVPDLTGDGALGALSGMLSQAVRDRLRLPDVVVVDTLAMAAPGVDENDAGAMGAVLRVLAELRRRFGCAVVLVHHAKKPQQGVRQTGMHALRGSSAIAGAADVVLLAGKDGEVHGLCTEKSRDGEMGRPIRYEIRGQDTGMAREDGRPEFGPVVLPAADEGDGRVLPSPVMQMEADVVDVVAAVERAGRVSPIDAIGPLANVPRHRARVAIKLAVSRGLLVCGGITSDRWYDLPTRAAARAETRAAARAENPRRETARDGASSRKPWSDND